jgi:hypothetical protein
MSPCHFSLNLEHEIRDVDDVCVSCNGQCDFSLFHWSCLILHFEGDYRESCRGSYQLARMPALSTIRQYSDRSTLRHDSARCMTSHTRSVNPLPCFLVVNRQYIRVRTLSCVSGALHLGQSCSVPRWPAQIR